MTNSCERRCLSPFNAKPGTEGTYLTLVSSRAERPCPAMDDDSLDELVDQSPGPDGHPRLRPAALASDAGEPPPAPLPRMGSEHSCFTLKVHK